jgi:hypothetical protein
MSLFLLLEKRTPCSTKLHALLDVKLKWIDKLLLFASHISFYVIRAMMFHTLLACFLGKLIT